jgi:predicted small lipoprotein YifL
MSRYPQFFVAALAAASVITLAGCGKSADEPAPPPAANPAPADTAREAALAAKEQELAQREEKLALQQREQEVARREAEVAAQQAAQKKEAMATTAAKKRVPAPPKTPPAVSGSAPRAPAEPVRPVVTPIVVPAGTQLTVALSSDLSTKTAKSGDTFEARLVSDLIVDGRRAAPAGSSVTGSVTDVVSGSKTIGGTPTLGLRFDSLVLENNQKIAINGELVEKATSDTTRDTAKIVGGAAAGAILGHQIKSGTSGKVVGGILGGAIGAVVAKSTGTEVELPASSTLTIALSAPIEIMPR